MRFLTLGGSAVQPRLPTTVGNTRSGSNLRQAALMRAIFRSAAVHIYDDQPDVLYSGGGILTVHTKEGGPRSLRLLDGKEVRLDLKPRSTVLLDNETGQVLIGN